MAASLEERLKQEEQKRRQRRVYSTELIDSLIKDYQQGYEIPFDAFFNRDIDLRAANITFKMTPHEIEEYQKCYDDAVYFVTNYCKFTTDKGLSLVDLRNYQTKIIRTVTEEVYIEELDEFGPKNRNIIWMSARQSGKTVTISAFLSWMIVFHSDRNILIVANKEKTSIEIVDKITKIFKGLPFFLKPGCSNFGKTGIVLDNGSKIISSATTNTASIGFTIHCVLLDEFAHIPENIVNNFWRSVYPTLSSSLISQCIITSTPNGTTNKFYEIWSKSIKGENSFVSMRTDYWEVPGHDETWAEQQRKDFGEEEFAQEFELQFNVTSKMLLKASDLQFIDRVRTDFVHKEIYGIGVNSEYVNNEHIKWHPNFDPNSISEEDKFVFLVDLAEGNQDPDVATKSRVKTPDSNSINILKVVPTSVANLRRYAYKGCKVENAFRFIQVGVFECNTEDEVYCAKVASALAYDWLHDDERESVRLMIEMNFNGKSFTTAFQLHEKYYDGTIQRTYHTKPVPGEKQRRRLGFKTTTTKEYYCLRGLRLINMKRIIVSDNVTFEQMKAFGYVKGRLKGIACHDDLSMPVFNHISRMLDDATFVEWLENILSDYKDEKLKFQLNQILEKWDMDNPDISDNEFKSMYGLDNNAVAFPTNPMPINPYSTNAGPVGNPYSNGMGTGTYSSIMQNTTYIQR